MSRPVFDCLVAGDANVDLLMEGVADIEIGTEKLATGLDLVLGGSSAITAFNLASLGASVSFVGVIGQDLFGRFTEEKLAAAGVDLTGLCRTTEAKTGITIWHSHGGRRAAVTYPGTIAMLQMKHIPEQLLRSARHLHMGAYFLQTCLHNDAPDLFAQAKKLGLTTSLDCNYDPAERWDSHLKEVLRHVDFFFPNEDEALKITGAANASTAARDLATLAGTVIVKRGAHGAFVASQTIDFEVPALRTEVVDTTGAGDSFNAGFLAAFLGGGVLEACAQAGVLAGARCVQQVGGTAAFERHEA